MPKKPKQSAAAKHADKEFEKLYRTIPSDTGRVDGLSAGPDSEQRPRRARTIIKRSLIVLLILVLCGGGWIGWKFLSNSAKIFGWGDIKNILTPTKLKGEDEGRVNILLAGNSADDPGHAGAALTDSIMVASIDTKNNTAYLLSIPRDLYVEIPDGKESYAKINETYQRGEKAGFNETPYAAGGMGLLQKAVSERLGMSIHYYALVNYAALRDAVNAVGGVSITVASSDPRGLYDPSPDLNNRRKPLVNLPNGVVPLDGGQALNLARARGQARGSYGFATGDFARTEHQRQILIALKEKATSAGTLSNPVKLGQLFDSFGSNVETDLHLGEVRRLSDLGKKIDSANITSASLNDANGEDLLEPYRTRSGQSALIPRAGIDDYSEIQAYVQSL